VENAQKEDGQGRIRVLHLRLSSCCSYAAKENKKGDKPFVGGGAKKKGERGGNQ